MSLLKEKREEKRTRKEEIRENPQPQPRARELPVDGVEIHRGAYDRGITRYDIEVAAERIEMPAVEVNAWQDYMDEVGWTFADGLPVNGRNYRRSLRMWHRMEGEIAARRRPRGRLADEVDTLKRRKEAERKRLEEAAANPGAWELCEERCANYVAGFGCKCKVRIPPALQPRPIPPEECPLFKAKESEA